MTAEPSRRNGERVKRGRRSKRTINRRAMALLGRKSVECKSADASASGGSHDLTISRRILACTKQAISKLNSWIGAEIGAETQRETRCFIIIANLSSNKRERERERESRINREISRIVIIIVNRERSVDSTNVEAGKGRRRDVRRTIDIRLYAASRPQRDCRLRQPLRHCCCTRPRVRGGAACATEKSIDFLEIHAWNRRGIRVCVDDLRSRI
jgi:hypothetical protein